MKKILFVTLAVIMLGCNNILPKPTESGKNTFGCKIDGKNFVFEKRPFKPYPINGNLKSDSSFSLSASLKPHGVNLYIKKIMYTGEYLLSDVNGGVYTNFATSSVYFVTSTQYTGKLNITRFDYTNRIVSGTFEFKAINRNNPTDIVKITKGRFDVDFTTLK